MPAPKKNPPSAPDVPKILVIGDVILDIYHYGTALKISSETPTIVGREDSLTASWGGAALLARNILELGGCVAFVAVLGDDKFAEYERDLHHPNLEKIFVREKGRVTTAKERFWISNHKLLQWDHLPRAPISDRTERMVLSSIKKAMASCGAVIVSDYRHGLLSERLAGEIVALCKKQGKFLAVDSQIAQSEGNHRWYAGAALFCVNRKEAAETDPQFDEKKLKSSLERLKRILRARDVVIKLGEKGSAALLGKDFTRAKPCPVKAVDTAGAGDALLAFLALSFPQLDRKKLEEANRWAALSTTVLGAEPPSRDVFEKMIRGK